LNSDNLEALNEYGIALIYLGKSNEAFDVYKTGIEKSKNVNTKLYATFLTNLGELYRITGNYWKAIECQNEAKEINEKIKFYRGLAANYSNLGAAFWSQDLKQYQKAKEMLDKAIVIEQKTKNVNGLASDYGNLGVIFLTKGNHEQSIIDLDTAENYLVKAIELDTSIPNLVRLSHHYGNLGMVYSSKADFTKDFPRKYNELIAMAELYVSKSLDLSIQINYTEGVANQLSNLGVLYEDKKENEKAILCWRQSQDKYRLIGAKHQVIKLENWIKQIQYST